MGAADQRVRRNRLVGSSAISKLLGVAVAATLVASISLVPGQALAKKGKSNASRTVSFEDDVVETAYLRPESSVVESINSRTRTSLIRIRTDFFKRIIRSATRL